MITTKSGRRGRTPGRWPLASKRPCKPQRCFEIFGSIISFGFATFRARRSTRMKSAVKAAEHQAVKNAHAIAASIEPFYGAGAKESFFKLLAGHYGAVKAYLIATVASDPSAQAEATQALTANANDIAAFLSKANPYLPKDAVASLLLAHGGHHIQQIQQLNDRKYEAETRTWEEMKKHVYQIADATADALAKQFAKKFS